MDGRTDEWTDGRINLSGGAGLAWVLAKLAYGALRRHLEAAIRTEMLMMGGAVAVTEAVETEKKKKP